MNQSDDTSDVRNLLQTAARTAPRESDPVAAVLRRRRHTRRRAAALTVGALSACTAVAVVLTGAGLDGQGVTRTRPAPPAGTTGPDPAPEPTWTPPAPTLTERGINGVQVDADGYPASTTDGFCLNPGTVTVVTAPSALGASCLDDSFRGPGALVQPAQVAQWTGGAPATPGITLIDGVPVYVNDAPYGAESVASISVPSRGVDVTLTGTEAQVRELLGSVSIQPWPGEREAPARAGTEPVATAVITEAGGAWTGRSTDAVLLGRLQELVDAAPRVQGEPQCLPAPEQQAQVDLLTTAGYEHDEDGLATERYQREYTYLLVDVSGTCDVVFSSTGAVLRPERTGFTALLQQLRDSEDFGDST
ncbi:hypothetical protein [Kineococcus auxinigenes]|uniref:hypothetical protein n=1 Tax=unclassified Kineococcus TaxID=2621656 RepID=UPI003D7E19E3